MEEAEEMASMLRASADGNLTLTGKACGVIVNPEMLRAAAKTIEQLNDFQNSQCRILLERLEESRRKEQVAVKCINDVETYLDLGSGKYAYRVIQKWRGPQEVGEGRQ